MLGINTSSISTYTTDFNGWFKLEFRRYTSLSAVSAQVHLMNWQRPFVFHGVIYIISCMDWRKWERKLVIAEQRKTFRYTNDFDLSMELKVSFIGEKELNVLGCGDVNATFVLDIPCNFIAWNVWFLSNSFWRSSYFYTFAM